MMLQFDTHLIVGCAAPSGVPGCEMEEPEQGSPLYKNGPSRGSGFLSRRWSRPERGGSAPRSAAWDRSGRAYITSLLQEDKEMERLHISLVTKLNHNKIRLTSRKILLSMRSIAMNSL